MTVAPLIDDLRRKAREDVDALWAKARADAEAYGAQASQAPGVTPGAPRDAVRGARAGETPASVVAAAKAALADRLHRLAVDVLPTLRNTALLRALAAELPPRAWKRVVVNPEDCTAAQALFPNATVVAGAAIAGGLDVEDGPVRISNTLEARLESAWPEILPALMKEVVP